VNYKELSSLPYNEHELNLKQYLTITRKATTMNLFQFLEYFIVKTTTISKLEASQLLLADAIACVGAWSTNNFPEMPLNKDGTVYMSDIIQKEEEPYQENKTLYIGGYLFDIGNLTLKTAILAEQLCYSKGDIDMLSVYLIAGMCEKGVSYGIKALLENKLDVDLMTSIQELSEASSKLGHTSLVLGTEQKQLAIKIGDNQIMPIDNNFFLPF